MFADGFLSYLRYEKNYSDYTIRAYAKDLSQFEEYVEVYQEGDFDPVNLDVDLVRNWMVYLLDNGFSSASVNRKLSSLKSFFKYLMKKKVVSVNPLRLVNGPKIRKKLPSFVREKDIDQILDGDGFGEGFEGVRNRLILELLYCTGIRRSELVGVRDSDVDLDAMVLKVTGKRNKQRLIPFGEGLKNLIIEYTEERNCEVGLGCGWLLVRKSREQISVQDVYIIVNRLLAEVPALTKRSPHVLRHSFATGMLNNGAELGAVKELLGHSSLASTSVYTHTTFEELKRMYHAHPRAKKEGGRYGN